MKRIITFLGALLLISSVVAAVADTPAHNLLVVPRTGLVAHYVATPTPSKVMPAHQPPPPLRHTPIATPLPTRTTLPSPSESPTPVPSPVTVISPSPMPAPSPLVTPAPTRHCGKCGGVAAQSTANSSDAVMCPMYCVN
ncbi:MAG TPA: hypothetical protein VMS08_01235 [Candidatus Saccharimonadia bacterium]|nr:hypothetical protein [Candidatus Saccharimonadia bacterium]